MQGICSGSSWLRMAGLPMPAPTTAMSNLPRKGDTSILSKRKRFGDIEHQCTARALALQAGDDLAPLLAGRTVEHCHLPVEDFPASRSPQGRTDEVKRDVAVDA